jgi:acylphosphatase
MSSEEIIAMNLRIEGEVQGCGFRDFAVQEGNARKLKGWVRNRADGSVEAVACGPQTEVEAFIAACMRGPRGARVTALNLQPAEPSETLGFIRRPTV